MQQNPFEMSTAQLFIEARKARQQMEVYKKRLEDLNVSALHTIQQMARKHYYIDRYNSGVTGYDFFSDLLIQEGYNQYDVDRFAIVPCPARAGGKKKATRKRK